MNMNKDFETSNIDNVPAREEDSVSTKKKINVYRFKFTDKVTETITKFAKIHQFDDRHDYKEAWNEWLEENEDLVNDETKRLQELGYDKDVKDKMFKSGRYYFRKKTGNTTTPVKRRDYITIDHTIIIAMDKHIIENLNKDGYTPAKGYDMFCEENTDLLSREIVQLVKTSAIDAKQLADKIKKTYKNRYFIVSRS